jgi:hypothetical protein
MLRGFEQGTLLNMVKHLEMSRIELGGGLADLWNAVALKYVTMCIDRDGSSVGVPPHVVAAGTSLIQTPSALQRLAEANVAYHEKLEQIFALEVLRPFVQSG